MRTSAYPHKCFHSLATGLERDFNLGTMTASRLLPNRLAFETGWMTIVLFSRPDCAFCKEVRENYLGPMVRSRPPRIVAAEFELNGARRITDWTERGPTEAEFARDCKARFAPTLMFFGPTGAVLAEPIVGLSRDFFGAYLEQRIQTASKVIG